MGGWMGVGILMMMKMMMMVVMMMMVMMMMMMMMISSFLRPPCCRQDEKDLKYELTNPSDKRLFAIAQVTDRPSDVYAAPSHFMPGPTLPTAGDLPTVTHPRL
jgi:hypothetical protein